MCFAGRPAALATVCGWKWLLFSLLHAAAFYLKHANSSRCVRLQADVTISTELTSVTASGSGSAELYSSLAADLNPSLSIGVSADATVSIDATVQLGMTGEASAAAVAAFAVCVLLVSSACTG